jgi:hypothetical protein
VIARTEVESQIVKSVSDWVKAGSPNLDGLGSTKQTGLSCPSASNSHGDKVFAVFDESKDELRYLSAAVEVPEIVKITLDMNNFALKNRLEGKCVTSSCDYWQGACRLGYFVSKVEVPVQVMSKHCAIRNTCRWYKENGPKICETCAFVRNLPVHATATSPSRFAPGLIV